jgi:hypothetical protein
LILPLPVRWGVMSKDPIPDTAEGKDPHAVGLGRLGRKVGGISRAQKLESKQRSERARKAAQARWNAAHKTRN